MAYAKINSITNANMAKVSSAAKAAIGKITSIDAPAEAVSFADTKSLDFDGTDDTLITGISRVNRGLTVACWAKRVGGSGKLLIGHGNDDSTHYNYFYMGTWWNEGVEVAVGNGSNYHLIRVNNAGFTDNTWHHIVHTISGDGSDSDGTGIERKIYVDGSSVSSTTGTGTYGPTTVSLDIAAEGQYGNFDGRINDAAIWSSVLTAAEITAIYNSGDPTDLRVDAGDYASSGDLIGYYWMGDEDSHPTITDRSGAGNNATMTNMTSGDIVDDVP
tara:strand:+ start:121 stop:939 length:819 start_codon:yes stop_codon:yes gene_type:complete